MSFLTKLKPSARTTQTDSLNDTPLQTNMRYAKSDVAQEKNADTKNNSLSQPGLAHGYTCNLQLQEIKTGEAKLLTDNKIHSAIVYNNSRYPRAQLKILQRSLGIFESGHSDKDTALAVAHYQQSQGLTVDGKAGPLTFKAIHADSDITDKDNLILFNVNVLNGISLTTGGGLADMLGHFKIEIHLPPGNCEDYEYRQEICGEAEFQPVRVNSTFESLNHLFHSQPGGSLPHIPNFREDGNVNLKSQYGHRKKGARPENQYRDRSGKVDQDHGCIFVAEDFPGLTDRRINRGEVYDLDIRFHGFVKHKTKGKIAERWWSVSGSFMI